MRSWAEVLFVLELLGGGERGGGTPANRTTAQAAVSICGAGGVK